MGRGASHLARFDVGAASTAADLSLPVASKYNLYARVIDELVGATCCRR